VSIATWVWPGSTTVRAFFNAAATRFSASAKYGGLAPPSSSSTGMLVARQCRASKR
jgi:hypothetical protein